MANLQCGNVTLHRADRLSLSGSARSAKNSITAVCMVVCPSVTLMYLGHISRVTLYWLCEYGTYLRDIASRSNVVL